MRTFSLIQGHVLDVLHNMASESVHVVCCSPPYFGLRDYGLEPQVWGGGECEHEWGDWSERHDEREATKHGKTRTTDRHYGDESRRFDGNHQKHTAGQFCLLCSAWRGSLGLEPTPDLFIEHLVTVFREVRRVLRKDGTLWLNLGDSYSAQPGQRKTTDQAGPKQRSNSASIGTPSRSVPGLKPKDLCGIPWRVALALQSDGWWLRSDIVWHKPNCMPGSQRDRPTTAHEYVFMLTKSARYFFDALAVAEASRATTSAASRGTTLTLEDGSTLNTNQITQFRGRGNLHGPKITIEGSMAGEAQNLEVVEFIRFLVVIEETKWQFVVDLQTSGGAAPLATVSSSIKDLASHCAPIRATIITSAPPKGSTGDPCQMFTFPLADTRPTTKAMPQPLFCAADVMREGLTALITLESDKISAPLLVQGTLRACHMHHDTTNTPTRNIRSVWTIPTAPFCGEFCTACRKYYAQGKPNIFTLDEDGEQIQICSCGANAWLSHFATFPPALVEPCIKAGTSERGCCPECGAPWDRVVETEDVALQKTNNKRANDQNNFGDMPRMNKESTTLGWKPTCGCGASPIPSTVLDPFAGAGTALLVALRLGRRAIGIELNPEYVDMSRQRILADAPLLNREAER